MEVITGYQDGKLMLSRALLQQKPRWKDLVDKKRKQKKLAMKEEEKNRRKMIQQNENNQHIQLKLLEENNNCNNFTALLLKSIDPSSDVSITLLCGLQVSENGIVKLIPALNHVNFG